MKHLPKHLRPRWRYLAVGLDSWPDADVNRGSFQRTIWFAAQNLLGDAGSADADLRVLGFDFEDGEGEAVVRVRHGNVEPARAALACLDAVSGEPVGVHVRGVSGTVRACEEKFLGRMDGDREETTVTFAGQRREAIRRGELFDVRVDDGFVGAVERDLDR